MSEATSRPTGLWLVRGFLSAKLLDGSRDCMPGSDGFRFQIPVPEGRLWTAKGDSVTSLKQNQISAS